MALLVLRRKDPDWYAPDFRCPGSPILPALGALASFGLIAFMDRLSILLGAGILVGAAGWYVYYAREISLKETESAS